MPVCDVEQFKLGHYHSVNQPVSPKSGVFRRRTPPS